MSNKKSIGLCYVVEDKPEDSYEIKVMPISTIPDTSLTANTNSEVQVNTLNLDNEHSSIVTTTSDHITATWLPEGDYNRLTAPDVCKGDIVEVWNIEGTDEYYWKVYAHNASIRKKEKVLFWFSNKSGIGSRQEENAYFFLIDTRNKIVHLHTNNNDGEACSYDIMLNTSAGQFFLKDSLSNKIDLNSPAGKLETTVMNDYIVNTKNITFNCTNFTVNGTLTKINSRVQVSGSEITHDGVNISKTHTHQQTSGDHFGAGATTTPPNN